jgi:hypothetical protein
MLKLTLLNRDGCKTLPAFKRMILLVSSWVRTSCKYCSLLSILTIRLLSAVFVVELVARIIIPIA